MILTLIIDCVCGAYLNESCVRVIEIDEKVCLYDLHNAIQDVIEFGRDHPFEFFIANSSSLGANRQWLTEKDEWEDKENDFFRIRLMDIWPAGRKKLYYLFDFGDKWTFEIRKRRCTKDQKCGVEYPRLIEAIGPNPVQYPRREE
ncbi:MAG: hypothetical protein ABSA46_06120 [Thermodesulfovibrionales bacterium]|jgi:hypothetical protein